jgi:peptidoglycan/LPS O-acetylase OafA/YrhL
MLICFGVLVLLNGASPRVLLPHLATSIAYVHNLTYGAQSPINPVAWTLEVEVQFYCLLPLFATVFSIRSQRRRRLLLLIAILLAGALQIFWWDAPPRVKFSLLYAVQFFAAGLLLADIYIVDWRGSATHSAWWDLVSIVCWPLIFVLSDQQIWAVLPLLILCAYVSAFKGRLFNKVFRSPLVTGIGGMCYTIYLFHYQLIPIVLARYPVDANDKRASVLFACVIYLVALTLLSCVYFLAVERPCMSRNWPHRVAGFFRKYIAHASTPAISSRASSTDSGS